jgi:hypothetical protein
MPKRVNVNELSPHDSDQSLHRGRNRSRGLIMRLTVGIVLAVILVALGVWLRFSPNQVNQNTGAAEASSTAILPIELHPKVGKDLPDKTVREPF